MTKWGVLLGLVAWAGTATPTGADADRSAPRGERRLERKDVSSLAATATTTATTTTTTTTTPTLLGTLVQTHTGEYVMVDETTPPNARFSELLGDRVTGESIDLDPRLLGLIRQVLAHHVGARVELVSGYRSKKLNEMMRKKGHHVASHSQHSLGHAVDFRIVLPNETKGIDPRDLEREIRALGWDGGVGIYTLDTDWFVHADVGPRRGWNG